VDLVSEFLSFSYGEKQTRNTTKDHNQRKILERKKNGIRHKHQTENHNCATWTPFRESHRK